MTSWKLRFRGWNTWNGSHYRNDFVVYLYGAILSARYLLPSGWSAGISFKKVSWYRSQFEISRPSFAFCIKCECQLDWQCLHVLIFCQVGLRGGSFSLALDRDREAKSVSGKLQRLQDQDVQHTVMVRVASCGGLKLWLRSWVLKGLSSWKMWIYFTRIFRTPEHSPGYPHATNLSKRLKIEEMTWPLPCFISHFCALKGLRIGSSLPWGCATGDWGEDVERHWRVYAWGTLEYFHIHILKTIVIYIYI